MLFLKRIPLFFTKFSSKISLHDMFFLPFVMIFAIVINISMTLDVEDTQILSYLVLALVLMSFAVTLTMVFREREISRYIFLHILFMFILISLTIVNGLKIKNILYLSISLLTLLLIMNYYRNRISFVLQCLAFAFSFCVYINFIHIVTHPMLWMIDEYKTADGYLLGGNYNQMGCRLLISLSTCLLCLRYSWLWIVNFVLQSVIVIASLFMVSSMTSLSMISLFLVFCLIPSIRMRKMGIYCLFVVFILFQVFVVFNGRGLENNNIARYIVVDVLHKDLTFTNRTYMWEAGINLFLKSPIWGWGYPDSNWYRANMESLAIGPHNFLLSILVNGGVLLFFLYVYICSVAFKAIKHYMNDHNLQILLFSVLSLWFMSLMEMYPYTFMFYALALLYYYPYYTKEKNRKKGSVDIESKK